MLNYEEELRKFKPSLEVNQIEEAVYKEDLTDMQDIVKEVMTKKIPGTMMDCAKPR